MQQRQLGPFSVTALGLGCMNLSHAYGIPPTSEQGERVLLAALDAGVTLFDTAALYGFGANETLVVDVDPLAADGQNRFRQSAILELKAVELDILRIRDDWILNLIVETSVVSLDGRARGFALCEQAPITGGQVGPGTEPERQGIGLPADIVLVDILPARSRVEERPDFLRLDSRRNGQRGNCREPAQPHLE